ncbi:MAG: hypothetical protein ACI8WB_000154 [Phenylobacterium sp.]|jgi:hypothetical protein
MRIHERRQVGILANTLANDFDDAVYLVESGELKMPLPSIALTKQIISQTSATHIINRTDIDHAAAILAPEYANEQNLFDEIVEIFQKVAVTS